MPMPVAAFGSDEMAFLCLVGALQNNHNQHAEALIRYLILPVGQKNRVY